MLLENPHLRLRETGHTDARGSQKYNLALGKMRAAAVAKALELGGVAADRIAVRKLRARLVFIMLVANTGHLYMKWKMAQPQQRSRLNQKIVTSLNKGNKSSKFIRNSATLLLS